MHQESLEYRTETQQHIETALGLYHIWVDIIESHKSSSLPQTWSGRPSNKKRPWETPGITLTEGVWQKLAYYGNSFQVQIPGKEYPQEMTYEQAKEQGLLDQPVFNISYYHLKEALKYSLKDLSLDERIETIPKKYWSDGVLAPLFQDAKGFDKAKAMASKRAAKEAVLDFVEDEILALVDEDDQPLTAKEQRQIAIKDLKRQEASRIAEDRLKKLRKD